MNTHAITKIVALARISRDTQDIRRQLELLPRVARTYGFEINQDDIVQFPDISGDFLAKTDAWRDLIRPQLGPGVALLAESIDRLSRSKVDWTALDDLVRTKTVVILPTGGVIDPADINGGYLSFAMQQVFSAQEKAKLLNRLQSGKETLRRRGGHIDSNTPMGTEYIQPPEKKVNGVIQIGTWGYTTDIGIIQEAYRAVAAGEPLQQVSKRIGVSNNLSQKLRSTIYKGIRTYARQALPQEEDGHGRRKKTRLIPRKPEDIITARVYGGEGQEPQAVSDELWQSVQNILDGNRAHKYRDNENHVLVPFTSFLRSGHKEDLGTGAKEFGFGGEPHRDRPIHHIYGTVEDAHSYYSCVCNFLHTTRKGLSKCGFGRMRAVPLNLALDNLFSRVAGNEGFRRHVRSTIMQTHTVDTTARARVEVAIRDQEKQLARLMDLYLAGSFPMDLLTTKKDAIDQEMVKLRSQLSRLSVVTDPTPEADAADKQIAELAGYRADWTHHEKRAFLRRYVPVVTITRSGVESITLRFALPSGEVKERTFSYEDNQLVSWADLGADFSKSRVVLAAERRAVEGRVKVAELSAMLGVHPDRVSDLVNKGKIPKPASWTKGHHCVWTRAEAEAIKASGVR